MDVFLEADIVKQDGQVNLHLDGVSTAGSYYYQGGKTNVMAFLLSSFSGDYDLTPFRLALRVIKEKDTEFYVAAIYLRDPFYSSCGGLVNIITQPTVEYGGRTNGRWCKMQSLDFAVSSGTLSWSNIRLIGMKRP